MGSAKSRIIPASDIEKFHPKFASSLDDPDITSLEKEIMEKQIRNNNNKGIFSSSGWEALYGDVVAQVIDAYRSRKTNIIYDYEKFRDSYGGTCEEHVKSYMTKIIPNRVQSERGVVVKIIPLKQGYEYPLRFQINIYGNFIYSEREYLDYMGKPINFYEDLGVDY